MSSTRMFWDRLLAFSGIFLLLFVYSQEIITETYLSPPVTLHPGQVANTDPLEFPLFDWPRKPISVVYFDSEVVDDYGNAVPLYDLYIHHYLIYVNLGKFSAGWCGLYNIWGIGAEMRGTTYEYPNGYGVVFNGNENFTANLHFIRTDTVPDEYHQECIECHCSDGTPSDPHGGIACCQDKVFCWGMQNTTQDPKKFYLQYTFKYTEITEETKHLDMFSYDVMAENNFDCRIEYQVSNESVSNGQMNVKRNTSTVLQDTDIVLVEIHQHIGGVNYTVEHWRDGKYIGELCDATPIYGNGTAVGNEDGYLVKIPTCEFDGESPYSVLKGDELVLTSRYDGRHIEGGGDYHEGVMGLVLYWGVRTGPSTCETKLKTLCGNPLPSNSEDCFTCAEENLESLFFADCGWDYNWRIVQFLCKTDNGVKMPYNINDTSVDDDIEISHEMRKEFNRMKHKIPNITDIGLMDHNFRGMGGIKMTHEL